MKTISLLCISVIVFICCNKNDISKSITDNNFKYWLAVKDTIGKSRAKVFYYFDKNGKWLVFTLSANGVFEKLNQGDVFFIETWKIINDSTINMGEKGYQIKKLTKTELEIFDAGRNRYYNFVAAPDSLIPVQYLILQ